MGDLEQTGGRRRLPRSGVTFDAESGRTTFGLAAPQPQGEGVCLEPIVVAAGQERTFPLGSSAEEGRYELVDTSFAVASHWSGDYEAGRWAAFTVGE